MVRLLDMYRLTNGGEVERGTPSRNGKARDRRTIYSIEDVKEESGTERESQRRGEPERGPRTGHRQPELCLSETRTYYKVEQVRVIIMLIVRCTFE